MSDEMRPKPIYLVRKQGGEFTYFVAGKTNGEAHAIYFADGSVFDCHNGWREPGKYLRPIVRVLMGREVI